MDWAKIGYAILNMDRTKIGPASYPVFTLSLNHVNLQHPANVPSSFLAPLLESFRNNGGAFNEVKFGWLAARVTSEGYWDRAWITQRILGGVWIFLEA